LRNLLDYLKARKQDKQGWVARFEEAVSSKYDTSGRKNYGYIAGSYQAMLESLLKKLPEKQINKILKELEDDALRVEKF
jgi:geranylgeranyl pyrophosphate synthase